MVDGSQSPNTPSIRRQPRNQSEEDELIRCAVIGRRLHRREDESWFTWSVDLQVSTTRG